MLLVVDREVLERRPDPLGLHAAHEGGGDLAGEQRILAVVLEVAAAERMALEVEAGRQQQADLLGPRLGADRRAQLLDQLLAPRRRHRRGAGEAGRGHALADVLAGALAQADRAVRHPGGGNSQPLDGERLPGALPGRERSLLLERQLTDALRRWSLVCTGCVASEADQKDGEGQESSGTTPHVGPPGCWWTGRSWDRAERF